MLKYYQGLFQYLTSHLPDTSLTPISQFKYYSRLAFARLDQYRLFILLGCRLDLSCQKAIRKLREQALGIDILMSAAYRGSKTSYLSSIRLKSPSTQSSSYHQFYSIIMEKSSNHQLLNSKISISRFPKFSISTAFKAQIHQIISKFRPNLQSTGKPKPPLIVVNLLLVEIMEYNN